MLEKTLCERIAAVCIKIVAALLEILSLGIVWGTIVRHLPVLKQKINTILHYGNRKAIEKQSLSTD
jgi:hypothetical protein